MEHEEQNGGHLSPGEAKLMKRSVKVSFWMPKTVRDSALRMAKTMGIKRLGRLGRYFTATTVACALENHRMALIQALANADPADQDKLINYFLSVPTEVAKMMEYIDRTEEIRKELFRVLG